MAKATKEIKRGRGRPPLNGKVSSNGHKDKISLVAETNNGYNIAGGLYDASSFYNNRFNRTSEVLQNYSNKGVEDLISQNDRRTLVSKARYYHENVPALKGCIGDIKQYAIGDSWLPYYFGNNQEVGTLYEQWLTNWFNVCNPWKTDFITDLGIASTRIDVDGEIMLHLTYAGDGRYPMIEFIGSNAIGSRKEKEVVERGPFTGYRIKDGIIVNDNNIPIGYNILAKTKDEDEQLSVQNAELYFEPTYPKQLRGFPALASSIPDWVDYRDIKDFEKEGIKQLSSYAFTEKNEQGGITPGKFIRGANNMTSSVDSGGNSQPIYWKYYQGGTVRLFGSKDPNTGIHPVPNNRPGPDTNIFLNNHVLRGAFTSIGIPFELAFDMGGMTTANMKTLLGKLERKIRDRQATIYKIWKRAAIYGLAKAIKLGFLPFDETWMQIEPIYPKIATLDSNRDSVAELNLLRVGATTLTDLYGKSGDKFREKIKQRVAEVKMIMDECQKEGVDINNVYSLYPNQSSDPTPPPVVDDDETTPPPVNRNQ